MGFSYHFYSVTNVIFSSGVTKYLSLLLSRCILCVLVALETVERLRRKEGQMRVEVALFAQSRRYLPDDSHHLTPNARVCFIVVMSNVSCMNPSEYS